MHFSTSLPMSMFYELVHVLVAWTCSQVRSGEIGHIPSNSQENVTYRSVQFTIKIVRTYSYPQLELFQICYG